MATGVYKEELFILLQPGNREREREREIGRDQGQYTAKDPLPGTSFLQLVLTSQCF
jgi:hypothetical protein